MEVEWIPVPKKDANMKKAEWLAALGTNSMEDVSEEGLYFNDQGSKWIEMWRAMESNRELLCGRDDLVPPTPVVVTETSMISSPGVVEIFSVSSTLNLQRFFGEDVILVMHPKTAGKVMVFVCSWIVWYDL